MLQACYPVARLLVAFLALCKGRGAGSQAPVRAELETQTGLRCQMSSNAGVILAELPAEPTAVPIGTGAEGVAPGPELARWAPIIEPMVTVAGAVLRQGAGLARWAKGQVALATALDSVVRASEKTLADAIEAEAIRNP